MSSDISRKPAPVVPCHRRISERGTHRLPSFDPTGQLDSSSDSSSPSMIAGAPGAGTGTSRPSVLDIVVLRFWRLCSV